MRLIDRRKQKFHFYYLTKRLCDITVFEKSQKSLIQHCERSELRLHFERTKVHWKCQKWSILASFWNSEACDQTVFPDVSLLIIPKTSGKCKNSNATFLVFFTLILVDLKVIEFTKKCWQLLFTRKLEKWKVTPWLACLWKIPK